MTNGELFTSIAVCFGGLLLVGLNTYLAINGYALSTIALLAASYAVLAGGIVLAHVASPRRP